MIFFDYLQQKHALEKQEGAIEPHKKPISSHLRILVLAIELQKWSRSVKLNRRSTAKRITSQHLACEYLECGYCSSKAAAYKMAKRDLKYLDLIFGIIGNEKSGLGMRKDFDRYCRLLEYWLEMLGEPKKSDRRMHVMLAGLIEAIDNGFRDDPIVVPELAKKLKHRFGNKNARDSQQPLSEMFDHHLIAFYLDLDEDEDGSLHIHDRYDALLLRLRPRSEVGDNADVSIILAMPGRLHQDFEEHINGLPEQETKRLRLISKAVCESHAWKDHENTMLVPYILYLEEAGGLPILTLWQVSDGHYRDVSCADIAATPEQCLARYIPLGMPPRLWVNFQGINT